MKSKVLLILEQKQQCNRRHLDIRVSTMPKLQREQFKNVDSPLLSTAAHERQKPQAYNKLMSWTYRRTQ